MGLCWKDFCCGVAGDAVGSGGGGGGGKAGVVLVGGVWEGGDVEGDGVYGWA